MRKGWTLIEMLVVVVILPVFSLAFAGLFRTLTFEIPKASRTIQQNTVMLSILSQMRQDINAAKALPESFGGYTASGEAFLIELTDKIICYQLQDGRILRTILAKTRQGNVDDTTVWTVPDGKMEWQLWRDNTKGYAVEVKTYIEYKDKGLLQKKMANSYIFFVGAFTEAIN